MDEENEFFDEGYGDFAPSENEFCEDEIDRKNRFFDCEEEASSENEFCEDGIDRKNRFVDCEEEAASEPLRTNCDNEYEFEVEEIDEEISGDTHTQIPFEFITGKRSDSILLYTINDKQLYRKCSIYKSKYYSYRCRVKNCKSRVYYEFDTKKCFMRPKSFISHNHGDQEDEVKNLKVATEIKNECTKLNVLASTRKGSGNCRDIFDRHVAR